MAWARIVLDYLRTLAWPSVAVVALWRYHGELRTLLGRVTGISALGVTLELETRVLALEGTVVQGELPAPPAAHVENPSEPVPRPADARAPQPLVDAQRTRRWFRLDRHHEPGPVQSSHSITGLSAPYVIDQWVACENLALDAYRQIFPRGDTSVWRPARLAGIVAAIAEALDFTDTSFDPLVRYAERLESTYRSLVGAPNEITPEAALNFRAACESFRESLGTLVAAATRAEGAR